MNVVLDASTALSWLFERSEEHERAISSAALRFAANGAYVVPNLWITEVANAVLVAERRGVLSPQAADAFLDHIDRLSPAVDTAQPQERLHAVLRCARDRTLSSYDATYLELAIRLNARLATFDRKLAAAATSLGVALFDGAATE